jgi:hypothetical protein
MCQAHIKKIAIILLQVPILSAARPKIRVGGRQPTEKWAVQSVCNCWDLEVFRHNHTDLQSVTQAFAHDPSVNYSTAQRPKRRGFKFENIREKDATAPLLALFAA